MAEAKNLTLKNFGDKVRTTRKDKNISQELLADLANLDRSYVGGVERGKRNISLENIQKIAKALGIKKKDLFDD